MEGLMLVDFIEFVFESWVQTYNLIMLLVVEGGLLRYCLLQLDYLGIRRLDGSWLEAPKFSVFFCGHYQSSSIISITELIVLRLSNYNKKLFVSSQHGIIG
jgi:hypothetical protein